MSRPLLLCLIALAAAGAAEHRYAVDFTADGKTQDHDTLVLGDELALPELAQRFGFQPGKCEAKPGKDGAVVFTATLTSAAHGKLVVAGTVTGAAVSGTRTWTEPGKPPIVHRFTGDEEAATAKAPAKK